MGFGYFSDYASCGVDDTESGDDICSGQTDSTGPVAYSETFGRVNLRDGSCVDKNYVGLWRQNVKTNRLHRIALGAAEIVDTE